LRIEIRIPLIRNRNVNQQICLLVSSELVTDFKKCGMNIKPLVIQQQTFTINPPKSMQAEFKNLKKAFLYTVPNKNFFFLSTQLSFCT